MTKIYALCVNGYGQLLYLWIKFRLCLYGLMWIYIHWWMKRDRIDVWRSYGFFSFFPSLDLWESEMDFHFVEMCFEIGKSLLGCSILYSQSLFGCCTPWMAPTRMWFAYWILSTLFSPCKWSNSLLVCWNPCIFMHFCLLLARTVHPSEFAPSLSHKPLAIAMLHTTPLRISNMIRGLNLCQNKIGNSKYDLEI